EFLLLIAVLENLRRQGGTQRPYIQRLGLQGGGIGGRRRFGLDEPLPCQRVGAVGLTLQGRVHLRLVARNIGLDRREVLVQRCQVLAQVTLVLFLLQAQVVVV